MSTQYSFSEGLVPITFGDTVSGKRGYMDKKGKIVIEPKFSEARGFSEGLAAFCIGCKKNPQGEYHRLEGGKWGYINKTGEIVVDPEYDKATSFKGGKADVMTGKEEIILKREDVIE